MRLILVCNSPAGVKNMTQNLQVKMMIRLGDVNPGTFREQLGRKGHSISDWAHDMLYKTSAVGEPTDLNLVVRSNEELGFPDGCTVAETFDAATKLGLGRCPSEAGPQLLLQCEALPTEEDLLVAMDPIKDSCDNPHVYAIVRRDKRTWLHASNGEAINRYGGSTNWVFVRPE